MEPCVHLCLSGGCQQKTMPLDSTQIGIFRTKKGELIKATFNQFQQLILYINQLGVLNESNWKAVKVHDLPKELQKPLPFEKVKALLEGCFLDVKQYNNGDLRLTLHAGLLGGMMTHSDRQKQLKNLEGHRQLANAIDNSLQIVPSGISTTSAILAKGGAVTVGCSTGFGTTMFLLKFSSIGNLAGVVAGGGVGLVATGTFLYFTNRYIKACETKAKKVHEDIQEFVSFFAEIPCLNQQYGKESTKVTKEVDSFLQKLKKEKYIIQFSSIICEFNEDKFKEIKDFYESDIKEQLVTELKLLILCCLTFISINQRPLDFLIKLLSEVAEKTTVNAVKNYAYIAIAKLHFEKMDYNSTMIVLRKINKDSDLKKYANDFMNDLQKIMESEQKLIGLSSDEAISTNNNQTSENYICQIL